MGKRIKWNYDENVKDKLCRRCGSFGGIKRAKNFSTVKY